MYANEDHYHGLSSNGYIEDADLNWLNQGYVDNPRSFSCPSTQNRIRKDVTGIAPCYDRSGLVDLFTIASSTGPVHRSKLLAF